MQGPSAHIDFETRSATDLTKSGVFRYAEDPTTWPWGFSWRIGDNGTVQQWRPGYPDPTPLLDHIRSGRTVVAHNAAFERTIWNWVIVARICPHWPHLLIGQQDCTMARAAAIAHPQTLDGLGKALNLPMSKDMEGNAVMRKLMRPRRYNEDGSITWWDDQELVDRVMLYCDKDVIVETMADQNIPQLSPSEKEVWKFDQVINERGVAIDEQMVERAAQLVDFAKKQNDSVMRHITRREVSKCSRDKEIIAFLNSRGVDCTSLAKGVIDDVTFLANNLNDEVAEEVIKLRQGAWKTSTAKYRAMQACVCSDGRIRGMLAYHGASTGRWAGRLVQPQNFPRFDNENEELVRMVTMLHDMLNDMSLTIRDVYEIFTLSYGHLAVLDTLSKALRSALVAPKGKKFVGGDFSNIEGRGNAWLAGEHWKLRAFQEYDDGTGPDLYKLAYARSFGVTVESVSKLDRQIGKVMELALGYQGGVGAFIQMGSNYGLKPHLLVKPVRDATPQDQWERTAAKFRSPGRNTYGLFEAEWTALQILVDNWRAANPAIVQAWWNYQDAAIDACMNQGSVVHPAHTNKIGYYSDGRALWCILPSGRLLCYSEPEVRQEETEYYDEYRGEMRKRVKRTVTFMGVDSVTRQWRRASMYGGLQCENIVQAMCRDIMVDAMFRVEAHGYPVILTVHDELLTEVDEFDSSKNEAHFADIMAIKSEVYEGMPVSVGAWEDKRYVK